MDHSGPFLFSELFCGTPPLCFKVIGGVGGWLPRFLSQPQSPFGPIGVGNGLDWVGIGSWGIEDSGVGDYFFNPPLSRLCQELGIGGCFYVL